MLIATCSSCGTQNPIDESRPDEVICSGCHKTLHLNYPDTEQKVSMKTRVKTSVSNAVSATGAFVKRHRKAILLGMLAVGGLFWEYKRQSDASCQLPQSPTPTSDPFDSLSDVADEVVNDPVYYEPDDSDEDTYTDWDILSYLSENCMNCGAPLAGGYYTSPWEDDDNEYGYWVCPRCGCINTDWNSGDDD